MNDSGFVKAGNQIEKIPRVVTRAELGFCEKQADVFVLAYNAGCDLEAFANAWMGGLLASALDWACANAATTRNPDLPLADDSASSLFDLFLETGPDIPAREDEDAAMSAEETKFYHWAGYMYRYYQLMSGLPSRRVADALPFPILRRIYLQFSLDGGDMIAGAPEIHRRIEALVTGSNS